MLCNIFRFCEVPYSNYKIFDIKTIQIEETIIRVLLRQRWKKIWVSPLSDNLDAMLQSIEFLRNDRPTSISQLVSRPRKDFRNFIRDVNTLAEYIFEMDNLDKPVKLNQILHEFETKIISGNAHWNHINFRSYFSSRNFPSGALADLVVGSLFSVLCNWAMSPSGVEFELQMVDLYGKLLGFPDIFLTNSPNSTGCGVTLSATSEGVIMAMLTARELMFEKHATNRTERFDVHSRLVAYMSDQAHSCHERATKLANVECRILETDENGSLRGTTFEEAIERDLEDGKIPFFYSLSFGSTGVIAFDNLKEISGTCEKHDIWIHADLAYTSSVLICPEYRYIIEDIEKKR
ncbi:unnamed protein product [Lepeophtheirus salmonis]|uniref:(salmon louse) hypothetical protein n=1 Tax=Lepeophtheirus salmonis TaxID=72036 RepID=A0A7R8CXL5_LEPSM|nr:unnamed protein product [Lepeophtheirus salmonis]CAF2961553.1 unnamed protein product [Lepeophtheirus salmonis]